MNRHETDSGQPTRRRRSPDIAIAVATVTDQGSQPSALRAENRLTVTIVDPESGERREIRDLIGWVKAFIDKNDAIPIRNKRLAKFVLQNRTTSELAGTNIFDVDDIRKARRDYQRLVEEELLSPAGVHQVHSHRTERDPVKGATRYDVAASKGSLPSQQFFNVRYTSDRAIAAYSEREIKIPTDVPEGLVQVTKVATIVEITQLRRFGLLEKHGDFMYVHQSDLDQIREENWLREDPTKPLLVYEPGYDSLKNLATTPALHARVTRAIRAGKITHVKKGSRGGLIALAEEVYAYLEKPRGTRGKAKKD